MTAVVEVEEWRQRTLDGVALTAHDRRLCERLSTRDGPHLQVDELRSGLRIHASSWVGVVQLTGVRIHVVPKLAGEHLGVLRMLDVTLGLDALKALRSERDLELEGVSLLDLVALLFVHSTERVLREGVRTAYVEHEEALAVLRGRLLMERQLRRRHGRLDRLECRYDDRSADIFDNRLLLAAAQHCTNRIAHTGVRRRAGRVRAILAHVCDASQIALPRRTVHYDRLNERYRAAHELAWLVLEGSRGLENLHAAGDVRSFAFLLDMNLLFEAFVEKVLATALAADAADLRFQQPTTSVVRHAESGAPYLRLIPDTVAQLGDPPVTVPIDAKYKRYSTTTLDRADVAQALIYAIGLGPANGLPQGMLVYPSESGAVESTRLVVRQQEGAARAGVTALGIPVPALLDELRDPASGRPSLAAVRDAVTIVTASARS